ncbi:anti-sigma factor RsbA family regulatory protein [Cryptosporangium phraense]|uniref:Sensor histidine kinase n=1 Tax=Cryptosporangium phraense TaxID=2593070 RepID=A0A545B115_9ACTN|nr:anti-sigma factor RsbA family regulatory protein [Cryptosporangium phraense]TQS46525.1 sensor histidine kinase [Cryptosporangium phraense]
MLGHSALVYSSPDEFLTCATDYVRQGLVAGDSVVLATAQAPGILTALGPLAERVEVVDEQSWHRIPAWTIGAYARRAERAARGGHRLRALVELRWENAAVTGDWERYESVLNSALAALSVDLCCAYDTRTVPADVLAAARHTHPSTRNAAGLQDSTAYMTTGDFLAANPHPDRLPVPAWAATIEFGAAEIPAVRKTALAWALDAGMVEDEAHEFLIAIYEIASNAVEHGGGRGVGRFWADGDLLFCEVRSALPIVDPLIAGYRPPGTAQERGRGLWLARQICERVTIHNNGGATVQLVRSVSSA